MTESGQDNVSSSGDEGKRFSEVTRRHGAMPLRSRTPRRAGIRRSRVPDAVEPSPAAVRRQRVAARVVAAGRGRRRARGQGAIRARATRAAGLAAWAAARRGGGRDRAVLRALHVQRRDLQAQVLRRVRGGRRSERVDLHVAPRGEDPAVWAVELRRSQRTTTARLRRSNIATSEESP